MLAWIVLGALLLWSFGGGFYFSAARCAARPDAFAMYVWIGMALVEALPIATGDWGWSVAGLPISILVGRSIILRRLRDTD
jgi:hypothetical protein